MQPVFEELKRAVTNHAKWENKELQTSVIKVIDALDTEADDVGFDIEDSTEAIVDDMKEIMDTDETEKDAEDEDVSFDESEEDDEDDVEFSEEDEEDD